MTESASRAVSWLRRASSLAAASRSLRLAAMESRRIGLDPLEGLLALVLAHGLAEQTSEQAHILMQAVIAARMTPPGAGERPPASVSAARVARGEGSATCMG